MNRLINALMVSLRLSLLSMPLFALPWVTFAEVNPAGKLSIAENYSLTVSVERLRNSKGVVQFSLYNKDGTIPDKEYKQYYKQLTGEIKKGVSTVTFTNLPAGRYAVNILHDENKNGRIDKGFILPVEGVGFTNYQAINFKNRPVFSKASFELKANTNKSVKVIYF